MSVWGAVTVLGAVAAAIDRGGESADGGGFLSGHRWQCRGDVLWTQQHVIVVQASASQ